MLECNVCAGVWLAHPTFTLLVERARAQTDVEGVPPGADRTAAPKSKNTKRGPLYRPCPACATLMHRFNFGKRSGVIVDSCKDHGVWFDSDELERIVKWVRTGGEERAKRAALEEARVDVGKKFVQQRIEQMARAGSSGTSSDEDQIGRWLAGLFDL